ncbi:MAG: hypothetical protein ACLUUO_02785 [Sellimonas intestinalis]
MTAIEPIQKVKTRYLGSKNPRLHIDEILIALSISLCSSIRPYTARSGSSFQS